MTTCGDPVFLLIFTRVFEDHDLELTCRPNSSVPDLPKASVDIVRDDRIEVADRKTGILKSLPKVPTGYDLAGLSDYLRAVKAKFPEKLDSSVLLAPEIPYDTLVQVMDTVRVWEVDDGTFRKAELFPDIAVGEAPLTATPGEVAAAGRGGRRVARSGRRHRTVPGGNPWCWSRHLHDDHPGRLPWCTPPIPRPAEHQDISIRCPRR